MKIKKNGKVINLTESDLKKIVKRYLNENEDPKQIVIDCVMENTSLKDITSIPEACIKMITDQDITKALECGTKMDSSDVQLIISKIVPISECVSEKMIGSSPMDEKLP